MALVALGLWGCGGAASHSAPPASAHEVAAAEDKPAPLVPEHELELDVLPRAVQAPPDLAHWARLQKRAPVAASHTVCQGFAPSSAGTQCVAKPLPEALAAAMDLPALERDQALRALSGCALPEGWLTALRAELAPPECADRVVDPLLTQGGAGVEPWLLHVLVAQSIGAKLARTVQGAPQPKSRLTSASVHKFLQGEFAEWVREQAEQVQALSALGAQLAGVGQAIAAAEAGQADMRFVMLARKAPAAPEFERDAELREVYEQALEQALEPRKQRGRDATLIALRQFADQGVIGELPRMARARELLGELYGGRRVDALDALMWPDGAAPRAAVGWVRVPSFLAEAIAELRPELQRAQDDGTGWAMPPSLRSEPLADAAHAARLGRARSALRLSASHFRRASADSALDWLAPLPAGRERAQLQALAQALHGGPRDVVAMMAASSPQKLGYRVLDALDELAKGGGIDGAWALYNATLLREIAPPDQADSSYFEQLAQRYRDAAAQFGGDPRAAQATQRAERASEIARSLTPAP